MREKEREFIIQQEVNMKQEEQVLPMAVVVEVFIMGAELVAATLLPEEMVARAGMVRRMAVIHLVAV
jgi:hypothetical protein